MPVPERTKRGAVTRRRSSSSASIVWNESLICLMACSIISGINVARYFFGIYSDMILTFLFEIFRQRASDCPLPENPRLKT